MLSMKRAKRSEFKSRILICHGASRFPSVSNTKYFFAGENLFSANKGERSGARREFAVGLPHHKGGVRLNRTIIELMDDKIHQLEHYNEITSRIITEDSIDGVGDLIEERQQILTNMDGISVAVKQYVSEQSIERMDKINALLRFEQIDDLNGDLMQLQDKIKRVQELREEIKNNDKKAYDRLAKQRDEIKQKLDEAAKSKQVADYCSSSNAADVSKGRKLNISN